MTCLFNLFDPYGHDLFDLLQVVSAVSDSDVIRCLGELGYVKGATLLELHALLQGVLGSTQDGDKCLQVEQEVVTSLEHGPEMTVILIIIHSCKLKCKAKVIY